MNMRAILLIATALSVIYPLIFWIPFPYELKMRFRKFNLVLPNVIGGGVLVAVWILAIPLALKLMVSAWKISLIFVSRYSWRKEYPDPRLMMIPCSLGAFVFLRLHVFFENPPWRVIGGGVLTGLVLCAIFLFVHHRACQQK